MAGAAGAAVRPSVTEQGSADERIIFGDALAVAQSLHAEGLTGKVDLAYIDPPFASQADYVSEARLDGPADGRVVRSHAYVDTWSTSANGITGYLEALAPALESLASLISGTGTLWVHLDWRAAYLARVLLDEILGRGAFMNEIVWKRAPNLGRQATSNQFGRTLDTLLVYGGPCATLIPPTRLEPIEVGTFRTDDEGRPFTTAPRGDYTDASIAKLEKQGRVHRTSTGRVYIKYFLVKNAEGVLCRERRVDALWTDVPPLRHSPPSERTGYPTQKPRALLERIIACASPPGGLVVDLFSGSGTTGEAARALGRKFVLGDAGAAAIATSRARLLRASGSPRIEQCGEGAAPAGEAPRIALRRVSPDRVAIELVAPLEPLAWAVDPAYREGAPFTRAWHSERAPGKKSVPALREADVQVEPGKDAAVRVFGDDGSIATLVIAAKEINSALRVAVPAATAEALPARGQQLQLSKVRP